MFTTQMVLHLQARYCEVSEKLLFSQSIVITAVQNAILMSFTFYFSHEEISYVDLVGTIPFEGLELDFQCSSLVLLCALLK